MSGPLPESAALDFAARVTGWMSAAELAFLHQRAGQLQSGQRWVEVGSWKGRSFSAVALGLPSGCHLAAVDHWRGSDDTREQDFPEALRPGRSVFRQFLNLLADLSEMRPDIVFEMHVGTHLDCRLQGDVVFLDAEHSEEATAAALAHWWANLRPGGSLYGHDYCIPSVRDALAKSVLRCAPVCDTIWTARA